MADYGLKAVTPSNEIQIDSLYRNLCRDQEGTNIITNDNTSDGYFTVISITSSSLPPLILVQPGTDFFVAVQGYNKTGDDYTAFRMVTEYNQSTIIGWKCCRETPSASGETYGLRVYNPGGNLVFDSGKRYFKVRSVHTFNVENPSAATSPYVDISHPDTSNPFYILTPGSFFLLCWDCGSSLGYCVAFGMIGLKKLSATSVRVGWFLVGSYRFESLLDSGVYNPQQKLIVCEV